MDDDQWEPPAVLIAVDLVVLTLFGTSLQVLLVERGIEPYRNILAVPGGFLAHANEELTAAALRELSEEAGLDPELLDLEQFGVYGKPDRDPRGRVVSVAYLAIEPRLPEPIAGTDAIGASWYPVDRVLAGDIELAFDHLKVIADGVERARARLEYTTLAMAFCAPTFTIAELKEVYEAVWGLSLDPRNFYRKVQKSKGFIVATGATRRTTSGRPARLFRAGPSAVLSPPLIRPAAASGNPGSVSAVNAEGEPEVNRRPIVVLTALDLEYQAIRENLVDPRLHRHDQGTRFEVGRLTGGRSRIALAHVGKGTHPAAVLAERAIAEFAPAALLFVGVAGALHEHIALGDVVVATHVYAFHGGTGEDDGLKARPRVWETSHAADQIARHLHRTGSWAQRPGALAERPEVHFGPIAAGEVVLNSRVSGLARWIREHYNDALAIEMEGAGVAQAGHLNRALPVVVIRGVSDRADGTKESTDRQRWQQRAVANAALFATALAEEISAEDDGAGRPAAKSTKGPAMSGEYVNSVHNENFGTLGVQAHTIRGGVVHVAGGARPPVDLPTALAEIRARFQAAQAAGAVDEDTYAAADAELAVAEEALEDGTPQSRGRLQLALKKFRGLVGDVSDLAAKVTIVLALARSLP